MRRWLVVTLLGACAHPTPATTPMTPTTPPPPAPTSPAPAAASVPLVKDQRLALGGGVTVHFTDVVVEAIEASPDGAYPGGSGITLALIFEGMGAPERREISLLSAGYASVPAAWFDRYRVTVTAVEDPLRAPRLRVVAERVGERVRPGAPRSVRVERGGEVALEDATMVFLGHSSKHSDGREPSPLMVAVEYRAPGGPPDRSERNVGADDRPQRWSWRDYRFTIAAHAYDAWMQLSIERLELEPVSPGA